MVTAFAAYVALAAGPGVAFYCAVLATKSFLVLLTLFSAFYWLIVLVLTAVILRGFVPLRTATSTATVVVFAVGIQELARCGACQVQRLIVDRLQLMLAEDGFRISQLDHLYMALAWGYGHGACQAAFLCFSLLPLTLKGGTLYSEACPHISLFLALALFSWAFGAMLVSMMVISMDGFRTKNRCHILCAPALHLSAALVTVSFSAAGACSNGVFAILALGVISATYAVHMTWRRGKEHFIAHTPLSTRES